MAFCLAWFIVTELQIICVFKGIKVRENYGTHWNFHKSLQNISANK